jgi:hypothetical protein
VVVQLQSTAGNAAVAGLLTGRRDEADQRVVQRLDAGTGGCPAPPVAPPGTTPDQDPKFAALEGEVRSKAKTAKDHPLAAAEVKKAQDAAVAAELVHVAQQALSQVGRVVQRGGQDDLPPARAGFPIPISGSAPQISVNLRSVVLTFTDTTNRFMAGRKDEQALYLAVRAIVPDQVSDDFLVRAVQVGFAAPFNLVGSGDVSGMAQGGEPVPMEYTFSHPLPFLNWLKRRGKTLALSPERTRILELGAAAEWLIDRIASDQAFANQVLAEHTIPAWFSSGMQLQQMHQHGIQLRAFSAAKDAAEADPSNTVKQGEVIGTASDLFIEMLRPVTVMEAIRADYAVTGEAGYRFLWPPDPAPAPGDKTPPKVAPPDRPPSPQFGSNFLAFLWTQQNLWPRLRSPSGTGTRRKVLATFLGWAGQVVAAGNADVALVDRPATANMQALPATLTSVPSIGPPLFDASAESDYHFVMQLLFPDLFEAFTSFSFAWARRKVPDEELKSIAKIDPFKGAKRPTWGEVGAKRFSKANEYARTDIKKFVDNMSRSLGAPGAELELATAGVLLRYVGIGFGYVAERMFTPRNEHPVSFAGDNLGPGLYIVACSATPVVQGQGFVREPSVAWMPVFVRTPEDMAKIRLDAIVKSDEDSDARLAELQGKLEKPVSWLDRDTMTAEAEAIFKSKQGLDETLSLQLDQLTSRRKAIESDASADAIAERGQIDKQIDVLEDTLLTRRRRGDRLTGIIERVPAVFVGDKGQVLTLALEATRQATATDDKGKVLNETWYVSDLTTPKSDDAERTAPTKAEAIEAALTAILEGTSGYGRGVVSFAVGKRMKTIPIEASKASILLEALENVATVASIAAVVAAPFTAGASLTLLLPIGVIGAVPSAYRIATRAENGTFRWDMSLVSDIVNLAGGLAGLGEVASGLKMLRLARGLMIIGVGANGLGVLVMGAQIAEQLASLDDLPPGLRAARTFEIMGSAMLQAGIMIGAAMVEKGRSGELRDSLGHSEAEQGALNRGKASDAWLEHLGEETRDALAKDPAALEAFRAMDPETRRALTMCGSLCIPIPPPPPEQLKQIRDFMDKIKLAPDHQGLREYLHDMRARGELKQAAEALSKCETLQDAQRIFDTAIFRWAKERGGTASKLGDRWQYRRPDGLVVKEWEIGTFKNLADDMATNSYFQAHHGIQDAWAQGRGIPGYSRDSCPAILLRDSYAGSPHRRITDRQISMRDSAPSRTYVEERMLMIDDMKSANVPAAHADDLVNRSDAYFGDLYNAWKADLRAKNTPLATIDATLQAAFGNWTPT